MCLQAHQVQTYQTPAGPSHRTITTKPCDVFLHPRVQLIAINFPPKTHQENDEKLLSWPMGYVCGM